MSTEPLPDELRRVIENDLHPVHPLSPVWLRTVVAVGILVVVLAFVLANASLRSDLDELPMWLSWGCSVLQLGLGMLLIGLAMREAIPGLSAPRGVVRTAAVTALAAQIMVGIATAVYSPTISLIGTIGPGVGCFQHESLMALPTFVVVLWLVFHALPLRAPVAGLLGGAGATVASDAVIHLVCPMSNLAHVLVWHTGVVVVFMGLGWLIGLIWQRIHWRRRA